MWSLLIQVVLLAILCFIVTKVFWRNVELPQPWKGIFCFTVFPVFLLAMTVNIAFTVNYLPFLAELAEAAEGESVDPALAFWANCPIALLISYLWYVAVMKLSPYRSKSAFVDLRNLFNYLRGERTIEITQDSFDRLVLRFERTETAFDGQHSQIWQGANVIGYFHHIECIKLYRPPTDPERMQNFVVALKFLRRQHEISIGQCTDESDVSIVGARISTITGKPVAVSDEA